MQSSSRMSSQKKYENDARNESIGLNSLNPERFHEITCDGSAVVLDIRSKSDFANSHIPGSVFMGLDGGFYRWASIIIRDFETPILLVAERQRMDEAVRYLSNLGFSNYIGYLDGGITAWQKQGGDLHSINEISAVDYHTSVNGFVIDVRNPGEFDSEHVNNAVNVPLGHICQVNDYPKDETYYLYCTNGYRSLIAASLMKSIGMENVHNIRGGMQALRVHKLTSTVH